MIKGTLMLINSGIIKSAKRLSDHLSIYPWLHSVGIAENILIVYITTCELPKNIPTSWETIGVSIKVMGKVRTG